MAWGLTERRRGGRTATEPEPVTGQKRVFDRRAMDNGKGVTPASGVRAVPYRSSGIPIAFR